MKKLIIIICFGVFLVGCGTKPYSAPPISERQSYQWKALCGKWYGKSTLDSNEKREWLVNRSNDGSYVIEFITIDQDGNRERIVEKGEWGVSGDIYFTTFKSQISESREVPADSTDPANRDSYKILKLNDTTFRYKHLRTQGKYEVTKVDSAFELK